MNLFLAKQAGPFASRIFGLERKRGEKPLYTPMFIPSVSSTVSDDWRKTTTAISRGSAGNGLLLVSAYDLIRQCEKPPKRIQGFRGVVLDSGGYEARRYRKTWSKRSHERAASGFNADIVVGFDPPTSRDHPEKQVKRQIPFLRARRKGTLATLLLHFDQQQVSAEELSRLLLPFAADFDILGITEKDLGPSFPDRLRGLCLLRRELDKAGIVCPLHLFGADDPLSLVLYSAAGVDIFDGLGWATEFVDVQAMARHDIGHGPLCPRWLSFATELGKDVAQATPAQFLALTYEWNLRELSGLMAEVRRAVLHDERDVFTDLCRRSALEPLDLLTEMTNGG